MAAKHRCAKIERVAKYEKIKKINTERLEVVFTNITRYMYIQVWIFRKKKYWEQDKLKKCEKRDQNVEEAAFLNVKWV